MRDACTRFPDSVNVAAAVALAGPGMDRCSISVSRPFPVPRHRLAVTVSSRYGTVRAEVMPLVVPGVHPVAACVVAALRRELQAVWLG